MSSKFKMPPLKFKMPAMDAKKLQSFDWRSLQKFTSAQAAEDLNKFLEKMPGNVGQTMLIMMGVTWACAGGMGLYTTVQLQQLTELRAKLQDASALQPVVPTITDVAIKPDEVKKFAESLKEVYKGLSITTTGSAITIAAKSTADFAQWREAIGHVQNGGSGWRVNIDKLCVGRECDRDPLAASLKINTVTVTSPAAGGD